MCHCKSITDSTYSFDIFNPYAFLFVNTDFIPRTVLLAQSGIEHEMHSTGGFLEKSSPVFPKSRSDIVLESTMVYSNLCYITVLELITGFIEFGYCVSWVTFLLQNYRGWIHEYVNTELQRSENLLYHSSSPRVILSWYTMLWATIFSFHFFFPQWNLLHPTFQSRELQQFPVQSIFDTFRFATIVQGVVIRIKIARQNFHWSEVCSSKVI